MSETEFETLANPLLAEQLDRNRRTFDWRNVGLERKVSADIFFYLLAATWGQLLAISFSGFVLINFLFAALYYFDLEGIANAQVGSFADAFFFSVQTFSTIGFGAMSPQSAYTHMLVTVESFAGLVAVALATGLIYAKFSRPVAAIRFSDVAVVHDRDGVPHLHMRFANERKGEIINATLEASILVTEVTAEGNQMIRTYELPLLKKTVPLFVMNWTVIHEIDEQSPFYQILQAEADERPPFFIILTVEGMDSTLLQTVQARHMYWPQHVVLNRQYEDMMTTTDEGEILLDHRNLGVTVGMGGS